MHHPTQASDAMAPKPNPHPRYAWTPSPRDRGWGWETRLLGGEDRRAMRIVEVDLDEGAFWLPREPNPRG